ncbi:MAG: hypothetical protein JSV45_08600 [Chromatiales bacterium]|nr:MAG: hypothetical protein JSV45_08600 [Chromatiales bacterium]
MSAQEAPETLFDESAQQAVDLGNRILDEDGAADTWEVASGLLAGAIQFWLFSRQPCDDPFCESCAEVSTAERRLNLLLEEVRELAESSDYFESPRDVGTGTH